MTEEDFVFAWLIATRASGGGLFSRDTVQHHIETAKQTYNQIKESCNEANSRTED